MDYEKTTAFRGNAKKALDVAMATFIPHGFRIVEHNETSVKLAGSGTLWTKGQAPLAGVSEASVFAGGGELSIKAEFGGVRKSIIYAVLLILVIAASFIAMFGITFGKQEPVYIALLSLSPWPIILPLMAVWMKSRVSKALDALLNNMASLGKDA